MIADVCGHGVSAAMLTSTVKTAFHESHVDGHDPAAVVRHVSRNLRAFDVGRFVTLFCARIDPANGAMEYVNAGHPSPLVWSNGNAPRLLDGNGIVVSPALPDVRWERFEGSLQPGEQLLLYTDGITEARGDDGCFGEERLAQLVPEFDVDALLARVEEFVGGRPKDDDWTLLRVRRQ